MMPDNTFIMLIGVALILLCMYGLTQISGLGVN